MGYELSNDSRAPEPVKEAPDWPQLLLDLLVSATTARHDNALRAAGVEHYPYPHQWVFGGYMVGPEELTENIISKDRKYVVGGYNSREEVRVSGVGMSCSRRSVDVISPLCSERSDMCRSNTGGGPPAGPPRYGSEYGGIGEPMEDVQTVGTNQNSLHR